MDTEGESSKEVKGGENKTGGEAGILPHKSAVGHTTAGMPIRYAIQ